jgi:alkyl hydroperoxide reductase subunit D
LKEAAMSLQALAASLPPYARDIARNLEVLAGEAHLTEAQKWGCFLACAHAVGVGPVVRAAEAEAQALPEAVREAARAAAAIMAMNNIYHHAMHHVAGEGLRRLPARLRMSAAMTPGVPRADFELWELAVSAINGCDVCLRSHEAALAQHGVSDLAAHQALRIAAVAHAASRVLAAEEARRG